MKRWSFLIVAFLLVLSVVTAALAEGETANAAKIGETEYATLDEAVAVAQDNDTIELLADCTTAGLNLSKNLTIKGKHTVTFTKFGIALWGKKLAFEDCTVVMNGIGSTPYTAEWNWMTICASKDSELSLKNVTMTLDGLGADGQSIDKHAIYFCGNDKLSLENSTLTIQNYKQDALEWDGGDGGYNFTLKDSEFRSDKCRSGITGTFTVKAESSSVEVVNSLGNGSNGSHFELIDSTVNFSDNAAHGLSAGTLYVERTTITANRNGANGVHTSSTLTVKNHSEIEITENGCTISSQWTIPGALHVGGGESTVDGTSTVTIQNNRGSGILLKAGSLTVADGAQLTVTNNVAEKLGYGGGVNVRGALSLPAGTVLYNNHAGTAGDDIYSSETGSVAFGKVGSNWVLDDCGHRITGWFYDGYRMENDAKDASRWNVSGCIAELPEYIHAFGPEERYSAAGVLALKAAHGIVPVATPEPTPGPTGSGSTIIAGTPTPAPIPLDPPTTGDEGGFGLYLAAAAGAALLMLALVFRKKEG